MELGVSLSNRKHDMGEKLNSGDMFPEISIDLVGSGSLNLPGDLDSDYNLVLFYRGHW